VSDDDKCDDKWITLRAVVELRVAKATCLTSKQLALVVTEALDKRVVLKSMSLWAGLKACELGVIKVKEYARVRAAETLRVIKGEEVKS
jgi:hypothetical protein